MEYPEDVLQITATTLVSVREHCHDEGSHFLTDHPSGQTKQHLAWCRFHNGEVKMAVLKGLKMQEPDFADDRILKLVPSWDKCTGALADCDENFSTINDLYLTW
jgi:hypothetical protein